MSAPWVNIPPIPAAVYRVYAKRNRLLYVGSAQYPNYRLSQHRRQTTWWREVHRTAVEWYPDRWTAMVMERLAIYQERPAHNLRRAQTPRAIAALMRDIARLPSTGPMPAPKPGDYQLARERGITVEELLLAAPAESAA